MRNLGSMEAWRQKFADAMTQSGRVGPKFAYMLAWYIAMAMEGYAVAKLPEPEQHSDGSVSAKFEVGEAGFVLVFTDGWISDDSGTDLGSPDQVQEYACALLAAAERSLTIRAEQEANS